MHTNKKRLNWLSLPALPFETEEKFNLKNLIGYSNEASKVKINLNLKSQLLNDKTKSK